MLHSMFIVSERRPKCGLNTVRPKTPSEISPLARKIEFESANIWKNGQILNFRRKRGIIRPRGIFFETCWAESSGVFGGSQTFSRKKSHLFSSRFLFHFLFHLLSSFSSSLLSLLIHLVFSLIFSFILSLLLSLFSCLFISVQKKTYLSFHKTCPHRSLAVPSRVARKSFFGVAPLFS